MNTDNRLIASAVRILLEPTIEKVIPPTQNGFVIGRRILSNVLDIDLHSMLLALGGGRGALILFDIEAAFPRASQEFSFTMLGKLGLPRGIPQLVEALYTAAAAGPRSRVEPSRGSK